MQQSTLFYELKHILSTLLKVSETYILHEGVLSLFWLSPNKSLHLVWSKWEGGVTSNVVLQGARFRASTSACLLFTLISPLPRTVIFPFQRCNHPRPQSLIFYLPAAPISIKSGGNLEGKARVNEPPCENPSLSTNLDAKHFSRRARQASHHISISLRVFKWSHCSKWWEPFLQMSTAISLLFALQGIQKRHLHCRPEWENENRMVLALILKFRSGARIWEMDGVQYIWQSKVLVVVILESSLSSTIFSRPPNGAGWGARSIVNGWPMVDCGGARQNWSDWTPPTPLVAFQVTSFFSLTGL